jgi:hypothetical protein
MSKSVKRLMRASKGRQVSVTKYWFAIYGETIELSEQQLEMIKSRYNVSQPDELVEAIRDWKMKEDDERSTLALESVLAASVENIDKPQNQTTPSTATISPQLGERLLLLVLRTKEERANIPGDLEEEFKEIAAKHGARFAKLWYYKQVVSSAWPLIQKAIGWGLLTGVGEWFQRHI